MLASIHLFSSLTNTFKGFEPASFSEPRRLLLLDGDDGTVACRIYGTILSGTLPRFSDNWTLESATRTLLRMNNLIAVRGKPGASMVGPADYLGNLEDPHMYLYTIDTEFPPVFYRKPIDETLETRGLKPLDKGCMISVRGNWLSGKKGEIIPEKFIEYKLAEARFQDSLFPNPGLLELDTEHIELPLFDARDVDLSSFKARLVQNATPFRITEKQLPSSDEYRLVTYLYEPLYDRWQVEEGSGLFLEKHRFSQTITPISPDSGGFVVLARTNGESKELELIAIQIPYNYTIIIEEGCIHGDATLKGFFMMGMTSDHTTMRTADTVFLKSSRTKGNVSMSLIGSEDCFEPLVDHVHPYVIYDGATELERAWFRNLTEGKNFVFNPFSKEYWYW